MGIFSKTKQVAVSAMPYPDNNAKEEAYNAFITAYPDYLKTSHIDTIRQEEFSRMDSLGQVYLDFTGGGLYSVKQIEAHNDLLLNAVYGNPHSNNPTSKESELLITKSREYVLKYFNDINNEYDCIFTANATAAIKIVGESYCFTPDSHLLMLADNHNSVNGLREYARVQNCSFSYAPLTREELRIDDAALIQGLHKGGRENNLFVFPAQSNVSGVKHDLKWIEYAQARNWDVMLDAAAFTPTNKLDLNSIKPDFVCLSFYKIFGYPTGLGCLLVRRTKKQKLNRAWFAGGNVKMLSVVSDNVYKYTDERCYEDGTVNYLNIPAVEIGFKQIERAGIESINTRITCLTAWLLEQLIALKHSNGIELYKINGPKNMHMRGSTISFNLFDMQGRLLQPKDIENIAWQDNISLRTGIMCNAGIDETIHGISKTEVDGYFSNYEDKSYSHFMEITGKIRGSVRISLGYVSNFNDVYTFIEFSKRLLNKPFVQQPKDTVIVQAH